MKRTVLKAALMLLLSVSVGVGCKKKDAGTTSADTSAHVTKKESDRDPSNKDNPFDAVGVIHNRFLDDFAKEYSDTTQSHDTSKAGLKAYAINWCYNDNGSSFSAEDSLLCDSALNGYAISDEIIDSNLHILDRFIRDAKTNGYDNFKSDVVAFEADILANESLTDYQKITILGASSVTRYSASYWWDRIDDNPVFMTVAQADKNGARFAYTVTYTNEVITITVHTAAVMSAMCSAEQAIRNFLSYRIKWW